jgi:1,2-dihydroxy-3-keto-5-methylthiopentene dioxygenase
MIRNGNEQITGEGAVGHYLNGRGFCYQYWDTGRLDGEARLKGAYDLSPTEQKAILDAYTPEIRGLKTAQGYITEDIVVLSPTTPNLEVILAKFDKEHHHTDDEVRFVVDGSGIFTIRQEALVFDVTVGPGDLFVVPAYTRHWFTLTPEKKIKCIRIFKDAAGWVAVYDEAPKS